MSKKIRIIILAAGKGTRMLSNVPKVLHKIAGKPMIQYVIDTAKKFGADIINLVYGFNAKLIKSTIYDKSINWILQKKQLGTGHAIKQVISHFSDKEDVLILYGDIPLISIETLKKLYKCKPQDGICILTKKLNKPGNYGRILRKKNIVTKIIEKKEANSEELLINEVNTGFIIANSCDLKRWLKKIKNNNTKKEYYITDIVSLASKEGKKIQTISPIYPNETKGVNNILQLSIIEKIYQKLQAKRLLLSGLIIKDYQRFNLYGKLYHGKDVTIDINVIIKGKVFLGNYVKIGAGCIIKNSRIDDYCIIKPYSIIENTIIKKCCKIGPFAVLRKKNYIHSKVQIGNFVELKKTKINKFSKAKHLSYLGDAKIGKKVNIGAGTITCNFDGSKKYKTIIGNNVFIGANSQLIAPINIAKKTTIASGTTVMKNIVSSGLVYNPKTQIQKNNWKKSKK